MTRYPHFPGIAALSAYKSDGTLVQSVIDPTNGPGVTLGIATYLFPLGNERYGSIIETAMVSLSAVWPTGIVGSFTIEGTNFPRTMTGADQGPADVSDWDITLGRWQQIDPTLTGAVYGTGSGTGTMTKYTLAITSGAGAGLWNIPEIGAARLRARITTTTGGFVRLFAHSKLGS
jgi:hypothetical protein